MPGRRKLGSTRDCSQAAPRHSRRPIQARSAAERRSRTEPAASRPRLEQVSMREVARRQVHRSPIRRGQFLDRGQHSPLVSRGTRGVGNVLDLDSLLGLAASDGLDQEQAVSLVDGRILSRFDDRAVEHNANRLVRFPAQVAGGPRMGHRERLQQPAEGETSLREPELKSPGSQGSADRPPQLDSQAARLYWRRTRSPSPSRSSFSSDTSIES